MVSLCSVRKANPYTHPTQQGYSPEPTAPLSLCLVYRLRGNPHTKLLKYSVGLHTLRCPRGRHRNPFITYITRRTLTRGLFGGCLLTL